MAVRTLLLVLFIATLLSAQEPAKIFTYENFSWDNYKTGLSESEEQALIGNVKGHSLFSYYPDGMIKDEDFHVLYLDGDDKPDVVYYGFAGAESFHSLPFIQRKGEAAPLFKNIGMIPAYVTGIKNAHTENFEMRMQENACCGGVVNNIHDVVYDAEKDTLVTTGITAYFAFSDLPEEKTLDKKIKVVNDGYRLRGEPVIDNSPNEGPFGVMEGNIIAEFPKGSTGTAIAQSTDETGRVWYFVLMDVMENIPSPIFYFKPGEPYSLKYAGWMSSRFMEEADKKAGKIDR